ncbi:glutamate receptor 1.4-like [Rosa rugosa]|uniref:glutamate receptor 1.4-like n=1 Tax=Rosa rugosa TaxID=74645 RepID=UPI002B40B231|nr:glutamate receptor 1.4-like [Rosa rugosa]
MAQMYGVSLCILFCFLGLLCAEVDEKVHYNSPSVVDKVDVGVILDMGSREAKLVLSCISMALSDFYNLHNNYSTRVVLHSRDSHGKALHALSAAVSLLDNIKVEAIISAEPRMEADLLEELGGVEVPVLSLSQPIPSPPLTHRYPFFIEIRQDETSQVMGIVSLIKTYKWKDVILLYESTKYAHNIIPSLISSFQEKNVYISYKSSISASSTNQQIIEELHKLMTLKTRIIVVHISHVLMPRLFLNVKKLGMMREGYAWIMTSTSMNFLQSMDLSVIESMQGVLGFKSHIPASTNLHKLTSRIRRKIYIEEPDMELGRELSADGIWAYDATWALSEAVERTRIKSSTTGSSKHGVDIFREILQTRFKGLGGEVRYPNGNLISSGFEIVNVIRTGVRRVGFWPYEEEKIMKESLPLSNRRNALSTNHLETIIWPGGSSTISRSSKRRLSGIKLKVGVPVKIGFKELVSVEHDEQTNRPHVTGFCIDVFEAAIRGLPYKVHYEFIPFENSSVVGGYDDLVYKVYLQTYDAVAGDTTITSNRSLYVDFTIPFTAMGVGILVRNEKENMWVFLEPLSANLWMTSGGFFILTGFVVWIIERPANQEFQGSTSQQLGTIFWFSFSTLVFSHREKLLNNLAKFVTIVWVFVVLVLTSSYTATLASMLTVKQINLNSRGNNIADLVFFGGPKPKLYYTVEQFADALSRGSKHGGVSAIIKEIPYLKIFLAKYPADYSMIKHKLTTNGFGFVFPKGSKLVRDMSRQIEILREEGKLLEMEKAWFQISDAVNSPNPGTLNLSSFLGVFLVTGVSSAAALILFFILSLKDRWHVLKISTARSLGRGQLMQLIRRSLSNKVSNADEHINTQIVDS